MPLDVLPPELRHVAEVLKSQYEAGRYRVLIDEPPWDDASYRTTLTCIRRGNFILFEVRSDVRIEPAFQGFARETIQRRRPAFISLAVPHVESAILPVTQMNLLAELGLGLVSVHESQINVIREAVDCATRWELNPRRGLGRYLREAKDACHKFNQGSHRDAIRDITEAFEDAVRGLARRAVSKQKLAITATEADEKDLEDLINCLALDEYHSKPQTRLLDEPTRREFLTFKETRNLGHHPRTPAEERHLRQQYIERMEMGARLISDIVAMERRIY